MSLIIGIDIGFRHTGVAVGELIQEEPGIKLVQFAHMQTQRDKQKRTTTYASDLDFREATFMLEQLDRFICAQDSSQILAIELPHGGSKSSRASHCLGIAKGLAAGLVALTSLPVIVVMPHEIKKIVGGAGNASKGRIQEVVKSIWPEAPWPDGKEELEHVADAAAALIVAQRSEIYQLLHRVLFPKGEHKCQ